MSDGGREGRGSADIVRWPGSVAGRSAAVAHAGLVFTVATASRKSPSLREQTADALRVLDARLAAAGTGKSRLLSVAVYITDMSRKAEMNEAWLDWMPAEHAPQRACLGVALEGDDLVEIVAVAAAGEGA